MNNASAFGARLRLVRKNAGLTQAALAEKVSLDETTISRIETGSQSTSFQSMLHLSDALNVHLDYLLCDYLQGDVAGHDPLTLEISELLAPLPDNYKQFIRNEVKNMVNHFPVDNEK